MKAHYMEFTNTVFHDQENLTVRLGQKWFWKVSMGDLLLLVKPGEKFPMTMAKVTWIGLVPFKYICPDFLEYEHDPSCHTLDGLREVMKKVYGYKFNDEEICTLVFFKTIPIVGVDESQPICSCGGGQVSESDAENLLNHHIARPYSTKRENP